MDNVLDFNQFNKTKKLKQHVKELREIKIILSTSLVGLTKYDKYSSVDKLLKDVFILHNDTKRALAKAEENLTRLQNE